MIFMPLIAIALNPFQVHVKLIFPLQFGKSWEDHWVLMLVSPLTVTVTMVLPDSEGEICNNNMEKNKNPFLFCFCKI